MDPITSASLKEILDDFCSELRNSEYVFSYTIKRSRMGNYFTVMVIVKTINGKTMIKSGVKLFKNDLEHLDFLKKFLLLLQRGFGGTASENESDSDGPDGDSDGDESEKQ